MDTANLWIVLLWLFEKHSRQGRVILPLLKSIDMLMSRGCLDHLILDVDFSRSLLSHLQAEETNCNDVHRLLAIIIVSLGLLAGSETKQVRFKEYDNSMRVFKGFG